MILFTQDPTDTYEEFKELTPEEEFYADNVQISEKAEVYINWLEQKNKTTKETISELKSLAKEVQELQDCKIGFGLLYEQEVRLSDLQNRIIKIITKL